MHNFTHIPNFWSKYKSEKAHISLFLPLKLLIAGIQPWWIQGIWSGDGIGKLDTITLIKY